MARKGSLVKIQHPFDREFIYGTYTYPGKYDYHKSTLIASPNIGIFIEKKNEYAKVFIKDVVVWIEKYYVNEL